MVAIKKQTNGSIKLNYLELQKFFNSGRRPSRLYGRTVANNTKVVKTSRGYGIKLHNTVVVDVDENNNYLLDSGGWHSRTTKERINNFSPVRLSQRNGIWYTQCGQIYDDGMIVDASGNIISGKQLTKINKQKGKNK